MQVPPQQLIDPENQCPIMFSPNSCWCSCTENEYTVFSWGSRSYGFRKGELNPLTPFVNIPLHNVSPWTCASSLAGVTQRRDWGKQAANG